MSKLADQAFDLYKRLEWRRRDLVSAACTAGGWAAAPTIAQQAQRVRAAQDRAFQLWSRCESDRKS